MQLDASRSPCPSKQAAGRSTLPSAWMLGSSGGGSGAGTSAGVNGSGASTSAGVGGSGICGFLWRLAAKNPSKDPDLNKQPEKVWSLCSAVCQLWIWYLSACEQFPCPACCGQCCCSIQGCRQCAPPPRRVALCIACAIIGKSVRLKTKHVGKRPHTADAKAAAVDAAARGMDVNPAKFSTLVWVKSQRNGGTTFSGARQPRWHAPNCYLAFQFE